MVLLLVVLVVLVVDVELLVVVVGQQSAQLSTAPAPSQQIKSLTMTPQGRPAGRLEFAFWHSTGLFSIGPW